MLYVLFVLLSICHVPQNETFETTMAQCSLFVLKVLLNTNQRTSHAKFLGILYSRIIEVNLFSSFSAFEAHSTVSKKYISTQFCKSSVIDCCVCVGEFCILIKNPD